MLHELQFSCRVRKNLYIVFGFFAYLCFSVYSLFPFHLFQLPWSLASDFFRSKTCRLYYLSFSTLYHATSDVCFQEKSQNLKNSPCFSPFLKMWTSLQNLSAFSYYLLHNSCRKMPYSLQKIVLNNYSQISVSSIVK